MIQSPARQNRNEGESRRECPQFYSKIERLQDYFKRRYGKGTMRMKTRKSAQRTLSD